MPSKPIILFICFVFICFNSLVTSSLLTYDDILEIYKKHIEPNLNSDYINRYATLPFHKNNKQWRWEGKDFPRVIAVLEFERFITANNIASKKALSLNSDDDPEWEYIQTEEIAIINYPSDKNKFDLHSLNLPEKDFDFVMVNQTLEHVYDPIHCLENIYKHMKNGGILYMNVPADNILHETPHQYYAGFTPIGLGVLVQVAGFEILSIGQWGSLEYLVKMQESFNWPDYQQLKNPGLNDINRPVITWIFASKTSEQTPIQDDPDNLSTQFS